jgi:hypothetical protein
MEGAMTEDEYISFRKLIEPPLSHYKQNGNRAMLTPKHCEVLKRYAVLHDCDIVWLDQAMDKNTGPDLSNLF